MQQTDEYRVEARRLARALAAVTGGVGGNSTRLSARPTTSNNVQQSEATETGVVLVPGFGKGWGNHSQGSQARAANAADRQSRYQPLRPKPRRLHPPGHAPHPTAGPGEPGRDRCIAREFRPHPDENNVTWPIMIRECLEDRSGERSMPWEGSSAVRGTPPGPTAGHCATWREGIPHDSLGLRPPLSPPALFAGAGTTAVPSSYFADDAHGVCGCSLPATRTGLSRRDTRRTSEGDECWGPRQGSYSRAAGGSPRLFNGKETVREDALAKTSCTPSHSHIRHQTVSFQMRET